jgi:hypothetical protein
MDSMKKLIVLAMFFLLNNTSHAQNSNMKFKAELECWKSLLHANSGFGVDEFKTDNTSMIDAELDNIVVIPGDKPDTLRNFFIVRADGIYKGKLPKPIKPSGLTENEIILQGISANEYFLGISVNQDTGEVKTDIQAVKHMGDRKKIKGQAVSMERENNEDAYTELLKGFSEKIKAFQSEKMEEHKKNRLIAGIAKACAEIDLEFVTAKTSNKSLKESANMLRTTLAGLKERPTGTDSEPVHK